MAATSNSLLIVLCVWVRIFSLNVIGNFIGSQCVYSSMRTIDEQLRERCCSPIITLTIACGESWARLYTAATAQKKKTK